jgi:Heterokaryon incompatibility protein (HET)
MIKNFQSGEISKLHFHSRTNSHEDDCPFWIDAICIDQSSIAERSHQVSRMKEIYKTAKEVVAWLGPEAKKSELAIARTRTA